MIIGDSEVCPGPVGGADDGIGGAGDVVRLGGDTEACELTADGGDMPLVQETSSTDPGSSCRAGGRVTPFGGGRGVVVKGPGETPVVFIPTPDADIGVAPLPIPFAPPLLGLPLPLPRPPLLPSFSPLILSFKNLTM